MLKNFNTLWVNRSQTAILCFIVPSDKGLAVPPVPFGFEPVRIALCSPTGLSLLVHVPSALHLALHSKCQWPVQHRASES